MSSFTPLVFTAAGRARLTRSSAESIVGCTSARTVKKASPNRASHSYDDMADSSDDDDDFAVALDADGRVAGSSGVCDPQFACWDSLLRCHDLAALRVDCELASWPLAASSFWLPCDAAPQNALESLAAAIFRLHTRAREFDRAASGAEWWANVSRSEAMARADGYGKVYMHFDKDERAYSECGLFVHPLASTVTYLTSEGAPTLVVDARLSPEGKYVEAVGDAHIVPPRVGRHVRFDGRLLHGAPLGLEARGDEAPYVRGRSSSTFGSAIGRGAAPATPPHSAVAISRTPVAHARRRRRRRGRVRPCLIERDNSTGRWRTTRRETRCPSPAASAAARRGQVVRLGGCELRRTG